MTIALRSGAVAVVIVVVAAVAVGALLPGCPARRPCRDNAQCEEGDTCVIVSGDDVGSCVGAGDEGEGEGGAGEGEGEGSEGEGGGVGEGEGEGEGGGVPVAVVSLDIGQGFACVVDVDDVVQCWGSDGSGQLGRDLDFGIEDPVPRAVPHLSHVEKLAVAQAHSCAIGEVDGGPRTVVCWGDATQGNLGQVNGVQPFTLVEPNVDINFLRGAVDVDNDADNNGGVTCIANDTGQVTCFGPQMPGFDPLIGAPVDVPELDGATALFVSLEALCARTAAGFVCTDLSVGAVTHYACSNGDPCVALETQSKLALSFQNVCALEGTDVQCGGENVFGVVDPSNRVDEDAAIRVVTSAIDFGLGLQHACAITLDGRAVCWGRAIELSTGFVEGDPALDDCGSTVPSTRCSGVLDVPGTQALRFSNISVRRTGSCARESNGDSVVCWGNDDAPVRTTFVHQ